MRPTAEMRSEVTFVIATRRDILRHRTGRGQNVIVHRGDGAEPTIAERSQMQGLRGVSVVHPHSVVHIRARKVNQGFDASRCRRHAAYGHPGALSAEHGLSDLTVS